MSQSLPDDFPLSLASQTRGMSEINRLFDLTCQRLGKVRSVYLEENGLRRGLGPMLSSASRGRVLNQTTRNLIAKLAQVVMKPGTKYFYSDTPELLAEFLCIAEGDIDGIPRHLKHLASAQPKQYAEMNTIELRAEMVKITVLLEERSIDLEAIVPTNIGLCALLDSVCSSQGISRTELAQRSIGVPAYANLLVGTADVSVEDLEPLARAVGVEAIGILAIYRSGIPHTDNVASGQKLSEENSHVRA